MMSRTSYQDQASNSLEVPVIERWKTFDAFLLDMGEKPKKATLMRVDNELGYFKANCIWATPAEKILINDEVRLVMGRAKRIRADYRKNPDKVAIALKYGVTRYMVGRIVRNECYKEPA